MVFSSPMFLFRYLPIILILYFTAPKRFRNGILFAASLIFYAWGEPVYVLLMIFSTIVDYVHGRLVDSYIKKGNRRKARFFVIESIVINLALLGFFKYADFFTGNINALFGTEIPMLNLALPIGISFYTFQTMSYTIDVYRGEAKVQKNIISFGAYVALFPQLIAGPIVQYKTIAKELQERCETCELFASGVMKFTCGLGKKVLLANNIGLLWDTVLAQSPSETSVLCAWLGIIAYCFQIYFDFSGYSDMAIGLGRMFGFNFLENFNYPYMSKSITEFWRRWHISLGTWFREYVYIPLGGNRCSVAKQIRNIAIVWFLTGFWHGASWNFVVWGVYFGILLVIEKFFLAKLLKKAPAFVSHMYTIFAVIISFVIFGIEDFARVGTYLKSMFVPGAKGFIDSNSLYLLKNYAVMLIILFFAATDFPKKLAVRIFGGNEKNDKSSVKSHVMQSENEDSAGKAEYGGAGSSVMTTRAYVMMTVGRIVFIAFVFLLSVAYLVDASYNPFLYFRF